MLFTRALPALEGIESKDDTELPMTSVVQRIGALHAVGESFKLAYPLLLKVLLRASATTTYPGDFVRLDAVIASHYHPTPSCPATLSSLGVTASESQEVLRAEVVYSLVSKHGDTKDWAKDLGFTSIGCDRLTLRNAHAVRRHLALRNALIAALLNHLRN